MSALPTASVKAFNAAVRATSALTWSFVWDLPVRQELGPRHPAATMRLVEPFAWVLREVMCSEGPQVLVNATISWEGGSTELDPTIPQNSQSSPQGRQG